MRTIKTLAAVLAVAFIIACSGCKATLQGGGAYAPVSTNELTGEIVIVHIPDLAFYNTDAAYDLAYSSIDAAFKFERDNRLLLWRLSPQIKRTLDQIRPQAVLVNAEYLRVRQVYLSNPVPGGLTQLQAVLAKINQIAATAVAALPKGN